jgi:hypothetical protein
MPVNVYNDKIKTDAEDHEWVERIDKPLKRYSDPDCHRIKLKMPDNGQHSGFVIEENDSSVWLYGLSN